MAKRQRRIVIATDFSSGSTAAANAVDSMCPTDAGLQAIWSTSSSPPPSRRPRRFGRLRPGAPRVRARELERAEKRLRARLGSRAKIRVYVLTGTPQVEICRLADHVGADLIMVGRMDARACGMR